VNFWVRWLIAQPYINRVSRANHNPGSRNPLSIGKKYISATFIPDCDYNAQARGFYSLIADISDRKQTEDALRQSEANYRNLVQTANSVIIRFDTQGRIQYLNDYGQRFFGYEEHQILGALETIVPETETSGRDLNNSSTIYFTILNLTCKLRMKTCVETVDEFGLPGQIKQF